MHAETERLTASDAHLLLNISDRLLDQVNEVRGAELSQCVQRLGTGLDCGVQLLLEDPIVVPVSLLPITGDCDGSIGVMEGVRGERGSARCGEDVLFFFLECCCDVVRRQGACMWMSHTQEQLGPSPWLRRACAGQRKGLGFGCETAGSMRPRWKLDRAGLGRRVRGRGCGSRLCRS